MNSIANVAKDIENGATNLNNMKQDFEKAVAHAFVDGIIDLAEVISGKSQRKNKSPVATIDKVKGKLDSSTTKIGDIKKTIEDLSKSFKAVTDSLNGAVDQLSQLTNGLGIDVPKIPKLPF